MSTPADEIDVALPTFVAESRELLQEMETALLALEQGDEDPELVNGVFRAAHTIKGSSGLFGIGVIVAFTHAVETVLDRVRAGTLSLQPRLTGVLLQCRDHLGALVAAVDTGGEPATHALVPAGRELLARLAEASGGNAPAEAGEPPRRPRPLPPRPAQGPGTSTSASTPTCSATAWIHCPSSATSARSASCATSRSAARRWTPSPSIPNPATSPSACDS